MNTCLQNSAMILTWSGFYGLKKQKQRILGVNTQNGFGIIIKIVMPKSISFPLLHMLKDLGCFENGFPPKAMGTMLGSTTSVEYQGILNENLCQWCKPYVHIYTEWSKHHRSLWPVPWSELHWKAWAEEESPKEEPRTLFTHIYQSLLSCNK